MSKKYPLIAQCNNGTATVEELEDLYKHDREISYASFARHVDIKNLAAHLGYGYGYGRHSKVLRLAKDYHVSYYVSRFRGKRVWHLKWSQIDHIFGDNELRNKHYEETTTD